MILGPVGILGLTVTWAMAAMQMFGIGSSAAEFIHRPGFAPQDLTSTYFQWTLLSVAMAAVVRSSSIGDMVSLNVPPFTRGRTRRWYCYPVLQYSEELHDFCAAEGVKMFQHESMPYTIVVRPLRSLMVWLSARPHGNSPEYLRLTWRTLIKQLSVSGFSFEMF